MDTLNNVVVAALARVIANHGDEVMVALSQYRAECAADGDGVAYRLRRLREAVELQAAGLETISHDGATFDARVQAANDALAAWR